MFFSERYGYKKVKMLKKDEMPDSLRTRIWNALYRIIFIKIGNPDIQRINDTYDPLPYQLLMTLWGDFFGSDLMAFNKSGWFEKVGAVKTKYDQLKWHDIYYFVEFVVENYQDARANAVILKEIELTFNEEHAPYCILDNQIVPLMSDEERKEIERAQNIPDKFKPVREHLSKALNKWSDRKNPDYENSIKESICAIESLVEISQGRKGTLGDLIKNLDIHPALKQGFSNLYGWTSDEEGVRHAKFREPLSCDELEARYMLITCSAFVNYVIYKTGDDKGGKE